MRKNRSLLIVVAAVLALFVVRVRLFSQSTAPRAASGLSCNMQAYKAAPGLAASVEGDVLTVQWIGADGAELRTRYGIVDSVPVVRELAVRRTGAAWAALGRDLKPEYRVVSGVRRFSSQQGDPLSELGQLTIERAEKEKWYAFRDAPLYIAPPAGRGGRGARGGGSDPGAPTAQQAGRGGGRAGQGGTPATPAFNYTSPKPEEIRRASASFRSTSCRVKTNGARIEVTFDGLSMGIFAGSLEFTVYRGTNLIRMDAVASTNEPSVAYKFDAGLTGFSTDQLSRLTWNDIAGSAAQYQFGAPKNDHPVVVRAANRVIVAEGAGGSLAAFPMPHQYFWPRQHEINLGYLWYRKDGDASFSFGIRQAEQEEVNNFTTFELFNAPPGTMQRMGAYFYMSPLPALPTRQAVLAFTHNDVYKPLAGYKTMVNHMHMTVTDKVLAGGSTDGSVADLPPLRAIGANIVGNSERGNDLAGLADYAAVMAKQSDKDFLITPWDEPGVYFGGHWNALWPKSVLWARTRAANEPYVSTDPKLGTVYRVGNAEEMQRLFDDEDGYWYHAHPRTKGTAGYPDAIWDGPYIKSDRYLGVAYKMGMGSDLSEIRTCEWRCFDSIDTMNNKNVGSGLRPKYVIADIDTYEKNAGDDLYPQFPVTYIKLDRVPGPTESWKPILKALRDGSMFVTTGEILFRGYAIEGSGNKRTVNAELEWTFPLEFVEVIVGDGKTVTRQTIPATDLPPNSSKRFSIPVDATGKAWVRFAAYDSAGNPAFAEPQWFNPANR
jgi:hypothetical protein